MYLFFDIECASVNKTVAKICVFGYCLADENFNVIEKEDLLINPHGEFHLTDRRGEKGLVLPYSYETIRFIHCCRRKIRSSAGTPRATT